MSNQDYQNNDFYCCYCGIDLDSNNYKQEIFNKETEQYWCDNCFKDKCL